MKTIIVGRFGQQGEAESARRELLHAGFPAAEVSMFYVNPGGQHAIYPVGGDEDESPGTHGAKFGAMRGAAGGMGAGALIGVATMPVLGPASPLLGAAVGAYTGSLVGALSNMDEPGPKADPVHESSAPPADVLPKAGLVLAVAVETPAEREDATEILGGRAQVLEETEGTLQDGDWVDFDPLAPCKAIR